MDPVTTIGAALALIGTIAAAVLAYIKWKRGKIENLAQAEADELRDGMDRIDKLYPPGKEGGT